jgi:two-component system CheB/CheR fusion protein
VSVREAASLDGLLLFLQQHRGFDFTGYKRPSLERRILRRMQTQGVESFDDYRDYLEVHPDEFARLFNTILINVTAFFRDPPAWEYLRKETLPAILRTKNGAPVRVWSAGCASGEEAYSIAILLAEALGAEHFRERVKIYATDVDEEALAQARLAQYSAKALEDVPQELRERYFEAHDGRFVFRGDLRRSVIFGRHDLVQDAPISRLDLIVCRNALMYFNAETQAHVLARFHFGLNGEPSGEGYLFLGRAEMMLSHGNLFAPLDLKCRVFAKVPAPGAKPRLAVPASGNGGDMTSRINRLRELAMDESPVARIVVDANGALASVSQRARTLFSVNQKDVGRLLQDLEVSYRPVELRSLIEQAYAERRTVIQTSVERRFADGEAQFFDVVVTPVLEDGSSPLGVIVSFLDVTRSMKLQEELRGSHEEVQTTNEELQSSNEELETTNEELQSSNEELETTNEELQSTNEELETMNEELHSANEELQTVNEELRQRTDEMNQLNSFFDSVLGSLGSGAIVVNQNFDILMWNLRSEDLWGLRADEVQGKSFLNLDIGLPVAALRAPVRACLAGEVKQELVVDAVNRRGKNIRVRVAFTPLLTARKKREGVIVLVDELQ